MLEIVPGTNVAIRGCMVAKCKQAIDPFLPMCSAHWRKLGVMHRSGIKRNWTVYLEGRQAGAGQSFYQAVQKACDYLAKMEADRETDLEETGS